MCCPLQLLSQETIKELILSLDSENLNSDINNVLSKEKLLDLFKNKILKRNTSFESTEDNDSKVLTDIISQGIYNEVVISKLLRNGLSRKSIAKAIKYGVRSLRFDELNYFYIFNITPENIMYKNELLKNIDKKLTAKLRSIGLNDLDSLNIILSGVVNQNDCFLFQLTLNGIPTSKIINWQGETVNATRRKIEFLEKLGLDKTIIQIVMNRGISEEAQDILNDLGYVETNEDKFSEYKIETKRIDTMCICQSCYKINKEEIKSTSSFNNEEWGETLKQNSEFSEIAKLSEDQIVSEKCISEEAQDMLNDLEYIESNEDKFFEYNKNETEIMCICKLNTEEIESSDSLNYGESEETLKQSSEWSEIAKREEQINKIKERKNYLRKNVMAPLTWAMTKTLKYKPSNPIYYIACQLLRWKHDNVNLDEINEILDFVIEATTRKDSILVEERKRRKKLYKKC